MYRQLPRHFLSKGHLVGNTITWAGGSVEVGRSWRGGRDDNLPRPYAALHHCKLVILSGHKSSITCPNPNEFVHPENRSCSNVTKVYAADNPLGSEFSAAYTFVDRKSTRLNSSHLGISYAVFCLKKKN